MPNLIMQRRKDFTHITKYENFEKAKESWEHYCPKIENLLEREANSNSKIKVLVDEIKEEKESLGKDGRFLHFTS